MDFGKCLRMLWTVSPGNVESWLFLQLCIMLRWRDCKGIDAPTSAVLQSWKLGECGWLGGVPGVELGSALDWLSS